MPPARHASSQLSACAGTARQALAAHVATCSSPATDSAIRTFGVVVSHRGSPLSAGRAPKSRNSMQAIRRAPA
eukprot:746843-Pleurochrysis_carterae.AAC.1